MGLSNAERQARHRARVKEKLAAFAVMQPSRHADISDNVIDHLIQCYRTWVDGMVEMFDGGDGKGRWATSGSECLMVARQEAVDQWNGLDDVGKLKLMASAMKVAGHRVALDMKMERYREYERAHPRPAPCPTSLFPDPPQKARTRKRRAA